MSREIEEIYSRLLARNYALTLFIDLEKIKKVGRGYTALCPFHKEKTPSFSFSMDKPVYHCFGCGESGDWIKYLEKKEGVLFKTALERLANEAGVELGEYDRERWEKESERSNAFAVVQDYFKDQLWTKQGEKALTYLKERGYSEDEIRDMELGFYTSQKGLADYLLNKVKPINTVSSLGLSVKGMGDIHKVVIPYRDQIGRLKGFIVRSLLSEEELEKIEEKKYKYNLGLTLDTLFNFNDAKGQDTLIVVEGFLDALIATQRGIEGVVATGGSSLTEAQLDNALRYGVKNFVLALDNDDSGRKGNEKALDLIRKRDLMAYVVTLPDGYKDPDELIRDRGKEAFMKLLDNPESGVIWKTKRILGRHKTETTKGFNDAIREITTYQETLNPIEMDKELKTTLRESLDVSDDILDAFFADYNERKARERTNKGVRVLLNEKLRQLEEGENPSAILEDMRDIVNDLRLEYSKIKAKPSKPLSEHLKEKYQKDSKREGKLLGYGLKKFKNIERDTQGIQPGFYIVGADTNTGKTAFLTNIFLDLLDSNPETRGIYFSFDDNKDVIINRFIAIKTSMLLNSITRKQEKEADQKRIERTYQELIKLTQGGRLDIKDLSEIDNIDALELAIREKADRNLFIVIDGLNNISVGRGSQGLREENIERADRIKTLVDIYKIPIIASAEVRKRKLGEKIEKQLATHDIMEMGKYGYNATLVWMLYPDNPENFKKEEEPILILSYDKNKISPFKDYQNLKFKRAKGIIEETI